MRYDIDWLAERTELGEAVEFLFFWGHTPNTRNGDVGRHTFSQWYPASFTVDGTEYLTAEHWMMAQKALLFENLDIYDKIIACNKPGEAKQLGREVVGYDDAVWKRHRLDIVMTGSIHKFNQNRALGEFLLKTNDKVLVEASPVDTIWGIGVAADAPEANDVYTWKGENLLGFTLMDVRDFFIAFGFFETIDLSLEPPWVAYPNVGPEDVFWKEGKGGDYLREFAAAFGQLDNKQKVFYNVCHPIPYNFAAAGFVF